MLDIQEYGTRLKLDVEKINERGYLTEDEITHYKRLKESVRAAGDGIRGIDSRRNSTHYGCWGDYLFTTYALAIEDFNRELREFDELNFTLPKELLEYAA